MTAATAKGFPVPSCAAMDQMSRPMRAPTKVPTIRTTLGVESGVSGELSETTKPKLTKPNVVSPTYCVEVMAAMMMTHNPRSR